jgi:PAS domain S-box-containing protein
MDNLGAVAALKNEEIHFWLTEKLTRLNKSKTDNVVRALGHGLANGKIKTAEREQLIKELGELASLSEEISDVWLLTVDGKALLGSNGEAFPQAGSYQSELRQAVQTRKPVLIDFYLSGNRRENAIRLGFALPLIDAKDAARPVAGVLICLIDPARYLYPLIRRWPTNSPTAETLLFRVEGQQIRYLNELRHRKDQPLTVLRPLSDVEGIPAQTIHGGLASFAGSDYRSVMSLAVVQRITDTPWFLMARVDQAEAEEEARHDTEHLLAFVAILLALLAIVGIVGWKRIQAGLHEAILEDQVRRQVLERHFDYLAKYARDIILVLTESGDLLEANDSAIRAYGYSREELMTMNILDLRAPETHGTFAQQHAAGAVGEGTDFETMHQRKDGSIFPVEVNTRLIELEGRRVRQGVVRDITHRKRREKLLARMQQRAAALLELSDQADALSEADLLKFGLEQAERLTGSAIAYLHFVNEDQDTIALVTWSAATLAQCQAVHDEHYPLNQAGLWADCVRWQRPVMHNDYASVAERKSVSAGHVELQRHMAIPVIEERKVRLILGVGNKADDYDNDDRDMVQLIANDLWRIVRRRRLAKALSESRMQLQAALDGADEGLWEWNPLNGDVLFDARHQSLFGYAAAAMPASLDGWFALMHLDSFESTRADILAALETHRDEYVMEYRLRAGDGRWRWLLSHGKAAAKDEEGRVVRVIGTTLDITLRKEEEQMLRVTVERLRTTNRELAETHRQLMEAEKFAAIGQLAAGMAHEINNPLGFLKSNLGSLERYARETWRLVDLLERTARNGELSLVAQEDYRQFREAIDLAFIEEDTEVLLVESRDGIERIQAIVGSLLSFSNHQADAGFMPADINAEIVLVLDSLGRERLGGIQIVRELGALPPVLCNADQISRVVRLLTENAIYAVRGAGTITLHTSVMNDSVLISVADTGHGIPPAILGRIFDPFFTTKPVGEGVGLGLFVAHEIVEMHRGRIDVRSDPVAGTVFQVILPIDAAGKDQPTPAFLARQGR